MPELANISGVVKKQVDLRPKRELLNSQFDSYKLSLDPLPTYKLQINEGIHRCKLSDEQFSYQHSKLFMLHNYLYHDAWHVDNLYCVTTDRKVRHVKFTQESLLEEASVVFEIPEVMGYIDVPGIYNITLHFTSPKLAIVADGIGGLYLLQTENRSDGGKWKILAKPLELEIQQPFVVVHSTFVSGEKEMIHCLLMHIDRSNVNDKVDGSIFSTVLTWITLSSEDGQWQLSRKRILTGSGCLEYAAIESTGMGIFVAADKQFKFTFDSVEPILNESELAPPSKRDVPPIYTWTQNLTDITVWFSFAEGIKKADVELKLTRSLFSLKLKNSTILEGLLFSEIDLEGSTWTFENNRMEVTLEKLDNGMIWQELIKGDEQGKHVVDIATMEQIGSQLRHLTTDPQDPTSEQNAERVFNSEELEECDAFPSDMFTLWRFNGDSHQTTHQHNLSSHQWLFTVASDPALMPAFCIRHDVDGLVWQPGTTQSEQDNCCSCEHVATFNALGYVNASKEQKKFSACALDYSYSAICDFYRHIYVYLQPAPISSMLRNRKTSQKIDSVAKQHLISLESSEEILGFQCSKTNIYVLTNSTIFAVKVKQ